jgi:murein L,D-transpeptidase YcbB/YkuD
VGRGPSRDVLRRDGPHIAPQQGMRAIRWAVVVIGATLMCSCQRDATVAISTAIAQQLDAPLAVDAAHDTWQDVHRFYDQRTHQPKWVDGSTVDRAASAIELLKTAPTHGLDADDYGVATLERQVAAASARDGTAQAADALARLDVQITASLLSFGRDVAVGRSDPSAISAVWKKRRASPDLVATLNDARDLPAWILGVQPHHPEYDRLRQTLAALLARRDASTAGIDQQVRRIGLNLERWRWLPDDLGDRHLLINVPAFQLRVREHDTTVLTMRVIVGKADGHETPLFSDEMESIVFSPYWNVPDSIATTEIAPAMLKSADYLARENMEVLRPTKSGPQPVDPSAIDWSDPRQVKMLSVRQRPGARNALGTVKFLFPNEFNVYLHDTPTRQLFTRDARALSHGCVRVAEPRELAAYLLRDTQQWNDRTISAAMAAGVERHVKLAETVPVHIVYFTAWIDDDGTLQLLPDIYRYDAKQMKQMAREKDS